jgi:uncharacterized membrane protein YebE (DUF533 family)
MNLSRIIDTLPHTTLSPTLAQHASTSARRRRRRHDWIVTLGDIAWQACVLDRRSAVGLSRGDFTPRDPYTRDFVELVMLRAMIAAAASDDNFDDDQRLRVLQRICSLELSVEERMFLMQEIQRPLSITQLARYGRGVPASCGIYAASLLTADLTTSSALLYLTALADALALSPALVAQIHRCAETLNDSPPGSRFPDRSAKPAML